MANSPYLSISDLRAGINSSDSAFAILPNQVVEAKNIDFRDGMIGSKRGGISPLSLVGSVYERELPQVGTVNQGGFAAAASGNIAISAITEPDGTGTTNHTLLVSITSKAAVTVSSVVLGAAPLTQLVTTNGAAAAGRLDIWYLLAPALAGGTLTVTLSGAGDAAIIATRWIKADNSVNPVNQGAATQATIQILGNSAGALSAQNIFQTTFAWDNAQTATVINPGTLTSVQQSTGTVRNLSFAIVGTRPQTTYNLLLSLAAASVVSTVSLRGRLAVIATTSDYLVALMRHSPSNEVVNDELWAQDRYGRLDRRVAGVWQGGMNQVNMYVGSLAGPSLYYFTNGVSLHGKFFIALDGSLVNRLVVWDGTILRWAGISASPNGPAAANTAGAGTFASTRYYRVRFTEQLAGVTLRRSEPGPVTTFVPSGANIGATITVPAQGGFVSGEGETHWELEASLDNVLFYRISTLPLGTTTFGDTTPALTGYAAFPLSENIGEYAPPTAGRHVAVDDDRLLVGGNTFFPNFDSRVSWSELSTVDGVGNDERIPVATRHFINYDSLNGGRITHLTNGNSGSIYVTKQRRFYKMIRTGNINRAYDSITESEARGCMMRAGALGTDDTGVPCFYFVDSNVGVCRFASRGIEDLMPQRRDIAVRLNKLNGVNARLLFYPKPYFVWVWLVLDTATLPNYLCCWNMRTNGWTDYTGRMATAIAATLFPNSVAEVRPLIGPTTLGTSYLCEADLGLDDDGLAFRGFIRTKPYQLGQLYRKFGVMATALLAKCSTGVINVGLGLIRDYGKERKDVIAVIPIAGAEDHCAIPMDNAKISECHFVQFELGDPLSYAGAQLLQTWTLDELAVKTRPEDESTS